MVQSLWADESGVILSLEIVLVATILLIGVIAGLASLRDAIITELADVGGGISDLNQSFVIRGSTSASAATADSVFTDRRDFGDDAGTAVVANERCLVVGTGVPLTRITGGEGTELVTPVVVPNEQDASILCGPALRTGLAMTFRRVFDEAE